jgi:hypothetical protein
MPQHLALQKYLGVLPGRKTETIKRLSSKRREAVYLFLQGYSPIEIADKVGYSPATIYSILSSELAQEIYKEHEQFLKLELDSLYQLAVKVVRETLQDKEDKGLRYRAAHDFLKGRAKYNPHDSSDNETAEDVVRRIMEFQGSVRVIEERRGENATR